MLIFIKSATWDFIALVPNFSICFKYFMTKYFFKNLSRTEQCADNNMIKIKREEF